MATHISLHDVVKVTAQSRQGSLYKWTVLKVDMENGTFVEIVLHTNKREIEWTLPEAETKAEL